MYWLKNDSDSTTSVTTYWAFHMDQAFGKPFAHMILFNPHEIPAEQSRLQTEELKLLGLQPPASHRSTRGAGPRSERRARLLTPREFVLPLLQSPTIL